MREREIKLYHGITEIDETFLEEAEGSVGRKPSRWRKWTAAAACLCFTAVMAVVCQRFFVQETETSVNQKAKHDDSDTVDTVPPGKEAKDEEDEEAFLYGNSSEITEVPAAPILYSELSWPKGSVNEEALALPDGGEDILAFDESLLEKDSCCMIVEGTVTDLYVKHYEYDVYDDKFEKDGVFHHTADTVVYEVEVEKNWYGEELGEKTILVEDNSYYSEPVLAIKKGMRYVLPLYEYGEKMWIPDYHKLAEGNLERESRYSTIYPYHPQIAVTEDGYYLIPEDWETLTEDGKEVIMDTVEGKENSGYHQKMYLLDGNAFAKQMAVLLSCLK